MGIEATREAGDGEAGVLAVPPGVTTANGGWRAQRLAGTMPPKSGYSTVRQPGRPPKAPKLAWNHQEK